MAKDDAPSDESEDLFDFDGLDQPASATSKPSQRAAPASAPHAAAPAATKRGPTAPQAAGTLGSSGGHADAAAKVAATRTATRGAPPATGAPIAVGVTRRVEPVRATAVELAPGPLDARPEAPQRRRRRDGTVTRVLLACAVLANFAFVGLVWRSMSSMRVALGNADENAQAAPPAQEAPPVVISASSNLESRAPTASEGELALEIAAEEIRRGEYERARARLYSLLSVIDRFEGSERSNLASRAQVLAADAYREQADALERSSGGFVGLTSTPAAEAGSAADAEQKEEHP